MENTEILKVSKQILKTEKKEKEIRRQRIIILLLVIFLI